MAPMAPGVHPAGAADRGLALQGAPLSLLLLPRGPPRPRLMPSAVVALLPREREEPASEPSAHARGPAAAAGLAPQLQRRSAHKDLPPPRHPAAPPRPRSTCPTPASAVPAVACSCAAAPQAPRWPTASRPARRDRVVLGACGVHHPLWALAALPKAARAPPRRGARRAARRAGRRDARGRGAGRLREHVLAALRHPRVLAPHADGGRAAAPEAAAAAWAAALEALLEVDHTRRAGAAEVLALPLFAPTAAAGAATEGAAGGAKTAGDSGGTGLCPHAGGGPRPDGGARAARFGV